MRVGAVKNDYTFTNRKTQPKQNENPISKSGEKAKLVTATFVAGLGLGAKLLFELMDGDFVIEKLGNSADTIVEKQKRNVSQNKKMLLKIGAAAGLLAAFISGFAILYTLFKAPKINYDGNVNTFKKKMDMDVYIKSNKVEKELYTRMNEKAKLASGEEKAQLKEQYLKLKNAKNKVPDFVDLKR